MGSRVAAAEARDTITAIRQRHAETRAGYADSPALLPWLAIRILIAETGIERALMGGFVAVFGEQGAIGPALAITGLKDTLVAVWVAPVAAWRAIRIRRAIKDGHALVVGAGFGEPPAIGGIFARAGFEPAEIVLAASIIGGAVRRRVAASAGPDWGEKD